MLTFVPHVNRLIKHPHLSIIIFLIILTNFFTSSSLFSSFPLLNFTTTCSTMSSILSSQGVVLATAMAVSGTVILLAIRHQKIFSATQFPLQTPQRAPRSCISSEGKKTEKKKKRVHFAEDVVDPSGDSEEFRKKRGISSNYASSSSKFKKSSSTRGGKVTGMPENRVALYNGILRDRVNTHRLACSY